MRRESDGTAIHGCGKAPPFSLHLLGCPDQVIRRDVVASVEGALASHDIGLAGLGERETVHRRRCRGSRRRIKPSGAHTRQVVLAQLLRGRCKQSYAVETARALQEGGAQRRWVICGGDHDNPVFGGKPRRGAAVDLTLTLDDDDDTGGVRRRQP